jgi:uncharacterized protein YqeY
MAIGELQNRINEDIKQAMRDKNELALSTLRMLSSSIKNKMISLRSGDEVVLTDEQVQEVIASEVKKRQDSIESYEAAGRTELAERELAEQAVLRKYLPAQLERSEIEAIVAKIVADNPGAAFGQIMGQAMAALKGKADGKIVGEAVKAALAK